MLGFDRATEYRSLDDLYIHKTIDEVDIPLFSSSLDFFAKSILVPLSHNFYVRRYLKFTFANKIEVMYERSLISVKV